MTKDIKHYAQNPTLIEQAVSQLETFVHAHAERETPYTWLALIDTAFDHGKTTPALRKYQTFNCYDFPDLKGLYSAAPYLLTLPSSHEPQFKTVLRSLLNHCTGRPMLSFLALHPGKTPQHAIEHWHRLHWVHTSDGQKLLLRFADTRTLANLPLVLSAEQWLAWTAPISTWCYVDRTGAVATLPYRQSPSSAHVLTRLDIEDAQLCAFIESGEPDAALKFLLEHLPEVIPAKMTGEGFYRLACQSLDLARQHGVTHWGDQMALVTAVLMSHGLLLQAPELGPILEKQNWKPGYLGPHLAGYTTLETYVSQLETVS